MNLKELGKISSTLGSTEKMPVLFLGHGSPMNAIQENEFVTGFRKPGNKFPNRMRYYVYRLTGKHGVHG